MINFRVWGHKQCKAKSNITQMLQLQCQNIDLWPRLKLSLSWMFFRSSSILSFFSTPSCKLFLMESTRGFRSGKSIQSINSRLIHKVIWRSARSDCSYSHCCSSASLPPSGDPYSGSSSWQRFGPDHHQLCSGSHTEIITQHIERY